MIKNVITLKVREDYRVYDELKTVLLGKIREGEVVEAILYKPTKEYFVTGTVGHEVYVAELNANDELLFDKDYFELITSDGHG